MIESYQTHVKTSDGRRKSRNELETTLTYLSPKIHEVKKKFSYHVDSPLNKSDQKTFFSQKTICDQYKVLGDSEMEIVKYKKVVSVLLSAAASEQRTDLISDVQLILNDSRTDIF